MRNDTWCGVTTVVTVGISAKRCVQRESIVDYSFTEDKVYDSPHGAHSRLSPLFFYVSTKLRPEHGSQQQQYSSPRSGIGKRHQDFLRIGFTASGSTSARASLSVYATPLLVTRATFATTHSFMTHLNHPTPPAVISTKPCSSEPD